MRWGSTAKDILHVLPSLRRTTIPDAPVTSTVLVYQPAPTVNSEDPVKITSSLQKLEATMNDLLSRLSSQENNPSNAGVVPLPIIETSSEQPLDTPLIVESPNPVLIQ